jgi:hypothetical protein
METNQTDDPVASTGDDTKPKTVTPIPASIVKAICEVQASMQAVKKSQYNKHAGFNFASTDDIYAALTLKMAEAGLVSLCLEEHEPQIKEVTKEALDKSGEKVTTRQQWMKATFTFVLATEDDTWTDVRARRTLFIQITGATSFQAAQSYAEKAWLRSLFKIATGDMDLDGLVQDEDGEPQEGDNQKPRRGRGKAKVTQGAANKPLPPRVGDPNPNSGNTESFI